MTTRNKLRITALTIVTFLLSIILLADSKASGIWVNTSSMTHPTSSHYSFSYNNRLYTVGGSSPNFIPISTFANINGDGTLGEWQDTSSFPPARSWITGAQVNNYVYIMGGINNTSYNIEPSVFMGRIEDNGDILSWNQTTPLPQSLGWGSATTSNNNRVYFLGGTTSRSYYPATLTNNIYYADINLSNGALGSWTSAGVLPEKMMGFKTLVINDYLYIFGGYRESGVSSKVQRANIDPGTGFVGQWEDVSSLPRAVWVADFTKIDNVIIGAGGNDGTLYSGDVYYSVIDSNGLLTPWSKRTDDLPTVNCFLQLVSWYDTLYITGGHNGSAFYKDVVFTNLQNILRSPLPYPTPPPTGTILFADDFENGSSKWTPVTGQWRIQNIDGNNMYGTAVYAYSSCCSEAVAGNESWSDYNLQFDLLALSGEDKNMIFRYINPSTKYGIHLTSVGVFIHKHIPGFETELTGASGNFVSNVTYRINVVVKEDNIKVYINNRLYIDFTDNKSPILNGKIGLRVGTGAVAPTEVWYDNVTVTSLHTPVTKTIFAPGLMASWNTDAILNCNPDTNTEWVLAPYAEDVYNPIIQAITESGWETIPYYYDWRKPVNENSQKLASFLSSKTSSNEKVNFVGHSMGGLVGRGYLDISDGEKLESLLTIGTPNTGSAYAYAPWEGGEIWSNSLIEKIALTIYLRHCGDAGQNDMEIVREEVPSIQDLLPTYPYLKRVKSDAPYLPDKDENLNTWLTGLNSDSKGVRLGYVAGTGYETIETIQTKDPNKKDGREGLWEDGKPAGRIPTDQGDGTVLASSAMLPENSWSAVINQNHKGLVNSVEGMSKILEFLGTPNESTITTEAYAPNSALVLIGYPGLFSVTAKDGKIKQSKEGMVALMNPESGNYKVNLLPKSENTLFIVAQFLPNGEIKYKEYNLKGLTPKFKTLKFDLQNPSEDILN